ncbi:unnamed protein product [Paramecium octaurelia]|uniref:Uncharacterized protein n=1 Tax=Paramecium octaurelia TaxID=43137 RepID=A0A8S1SS57_PAROT|nr:unnamed protein product [Paramecium octaurelia]
MLLSNEVVRWEWQPFNNNIVHNGQTLRIEASKVIKYQNTNQSYQLDLKLWKPFPFNSNIGWNWHKSWNIPELECQLKIDNDLDHHVLNTLTIVANVYIVKHNYDKMEMESIGCKGCSEGVFRNGISILRQLKFNTTSYKNEYQKFQIVVVVSQINSSQQSIIDAKCSPYIFVDSRKHARQQALNNNIQLIIDPFLPENLEKQFVKKERKNQPKCLLKVDNTIQGLMNYFTAPNIRHKIRHPLFLAIKFEKCVKLYLKKELFVKNCKDAILRVQSILMKSSQERRDSHKEMALLFQVDQTNEQEFKKVYEISQIFENDIFMLFLKEDQIPQGYIPIEDISRIKYHYKQVYPNLINQKSLIIYQSENQEEQSIVKQTKLNEQNNENQIDTHLSIKQCNQYIAQQDECNSQVLNYNNQLSYYYNFFQQQQQLKQQEQLQQFQQEQLFQFQQQQLYNNMQQQIYQQQQYYMMQQQNYQYNRFY